LPWPIDYTVPHFVGGKIGTPCSRMLPSVIGGPGGCLVSFDNFVGAR
jgi:hypothetical protein